MGPTRAIEGVRRDRSNGGAGSRARLALALALALAVALAASCAPRPAATPAVDVPSPPPRSHEPSPPPVAAVEERWLDLAIEGDWLVSRGCAVERGGALWCWGHPLPLPPAAQPRPGGGAYRQALRGEAPPRRIPGIDDARAVAVSRSHTCRIADDGSVRCVDDRGDAWWVIEGVEEAREVVLAGARGCALQADGGLRCWRHRALALPLLEDVVDVDLRADRGCALQGDGSIRCWREAIGHAGALRAPVLRVHEPDARALAIDEHHLWFVTADGRIGRLAAAQTASDEPWTEIDVVPGAVDIAAADDHVCVRTIDDVALCRGRGSHGQLGDGASRPRKRFVAVADVRARGLALSDLQTCVRTPESIACAGLDVAGAFATPGRAGAPPQHALPGLRAKALAAHGAVTCAVDDDDALRCWGSELLTPHHRDRDRDFGVEAAATPVLVGAGVGALRGLWTHSESVYWAGDDGLVRHASRTHGSPDPRLTVSGWTGDPAETIRELGGDALACAIEGSPAATRLRCGRSPRDLRPVAAVARPLAVAGDGATICAIDRRAGIVCVPFAQPGGGEPLQTHAVLRGIPRPRALAAAAGAVCVVGGDDRVRCARGRVDELETSQSHQLRLVLGPPVDVGLSEVVAIAGGDRRFCSLDRAGAVRCWIPGEGAVYEDETPTITEPLVELVAGSDHFCARARGGAVTCWGHDRFGQLGRLPADVRLRATPLTFAAE